MQTYEIVRLDHQGREVARKQMHCADEEEALPTALFFLCALALALRSLARFSCSRRASSSAGRWT